MENTTASDDHFIAAIHQATALCDFQTDHRQRRSLGLKVEPEPEPDPPFMDVDDPIEFIPHVHDFYAFHSERAQ